MKNIIIVADIKVKEKFLDEVYEALNKLHFNTHKYDKGCIQYDFHQDLEDKYTFTFIETWENETLLEEHIKKQHFLDFVSSVDGKLESKIVKKLEKIA